MPSNTAQTLCRCCQTVSRCRYHDNWEMCLQVGAHEVLADLLMRYMAELSSTSHSYAELAGRTATNICDVVGFRRALLTLWHHLSRLLCTQPTSHRQRAVSSRFIAVDVPRPPSAVALVERVKVWEVSTNYPAVSGYSLMCLQLLALEDMGVKAEDLVMYSQVEVSHLRPP